VKSKLRNAEYYDVQPIFDELHGKSKNNFIFKSLMSLISCDENIKLAFRNIKKNKGSRTAGTDNKTIKDLEKWDTDKLINHIKKRFNFYQPQAIRRVEIPKANGKMRPLGIPTIMDRLIQQCIYQVLEPIAEAKFHDRSNGFRPNRSAEHAMAQSYRMIQIQNLHYVVDIDIKSFFDNVQHGKLLKQIWHLGIRDKKLLKILSLMLKAEVAGIGFPDKGTPQGGIISPLLSNIVLNELDWWVASQWETISTKKEYSHPINSNGSINRGNTYEALRKINLKECFIVRYADDFKIFCRYKEDAQRMFVATKLWLKERLGLEINDEKSKVINLKNHYSEFLGFRLKAKLKGKNSKQADKFVAKSHLSNKAIEEIKKKTSEMISRIQRPKNQNEQTKQIGIYNSYVIGIHNYYRFASNVSLDFNKIAFQVNRKLYTRLKKEKFSKIGIIKFIYIKERYGNSKQMRFLNCQPIVPIGFVQHKNPMYKKRSVNKFTAKGREEIHKKLDTVNMQILHYLMRNPIPDRSIEYNDNRLALYCATKGKCAITSVQLEIDDIHFHHKTARKDGGNDKYDNLLLVDKKVHFLLHATIKETIEKYLSIISPNKKQLDKLNKYRKFLNLAEFSENSFVN